MRCGERESGVGQIYMCAYMSLQSLERRMIPAAGWALKRGWLNRLAMNRGSIALTAALEK
eukprot:5683161-Pyramimonas_sp.AAC.1